MAVQAYTTSTAAAAKHQLTAAYRHFLLLLPTLLRLYSYVPGKLPGLRALVSFPFCSVGVVPLLPEEPTNRMSPRLTASLCTRKVNSSATTNNADREHK